MPVDERSGGHRMSYQRPPTINGLKTRDMVRICAKGEDNVEAPPLEVNSPISDGDECRIFRGDQALYFRSSWRRTPTSCSSTAGVGDIENIALIGNTISLQRSSRPTTSQKRSTATTMAPHHPYDMILMSLPTAESEPDGAWSGQPPGDFNYQQGGIPAECIKCMR